MAAMKIRTKGQGKRDGYDPLMAPDPVAWLALDEDLRRDRVERYHRAAGIRIPNAAVHAIIHTVVENQIAQGLEPVQRVLARLMEEGLDRHEALHAIGSVLARRLHAMMKEQAADSGEYLQAIEGLTAESWKAGQD
jgi:hypothetical protein